MRTSIDLDEDALIAARHVAQRERISLADAISEFNRRRASWGAVPGHANGRERAPLRGRFALLPARDEIVTPQHMRELTVREPICAPPDMTSSLPFHRGRAGSRGHICVNERRR